MPSELFEKMLLSAARDAGVALKLVEARRQAPDHPTLMHVPENGLPEILSISNCLEIIVMHVLKTDYLKFYLFQIV